MSTTSTTSKPAWLQIYDTLAEQIQRGLYPAGSLLPSENTLAKQFSVTRATLRKSLNLLQQQDLVYASQGKGVTVKHHLQRYTIRGDQNFSQGLEASGADISTRTLNIDLIDAPENIATELQLATGEKVWCLHRLRMVSGLPTLLSKKYFPHAIFPGFDSVYPRKSSVVSVYRHYGIEHFNRAETRVRVGFLNNEEAKLLNQSTATPAMFTQSLNTTDEGTVIEFSDGRWPHNGIELVF